jgi:hypothetical protein
VPRTSSADALRAALARLPLVVVDAACRTHAAALADYPDGPRPWSLITLHGAGACGRGELVAWTRAAHERLAARLAAVPRGAARLGDWAAEAARRFRDPYERAALEAAAVDLALRQHETSLFRLAGTAPRPVRYVVSLGPAADPLPRVGREPAAVELKIDVDPRWEEATWAALAARGGVAVLDFKGGGRPADLARAARFLPEALLEDPGPPVPAALRARVAADIPLTAAAALDALAVAPAAVNLKPARMGGVLEALDCAARCAARGIAVYLGGMWEVGPGRAQLGELAALLAPDGPNDVAPLAVGEAAPPRPARLAVVADGAGFGAAA